MNCPKCQFENPEGSAFCGDCGASLQLSCPNCGSNPPPGFKFCNNCGQDLRGPPEELRKELSFDQKIEKIQKYLPKGLTEKILSQKERIEGERKHVTVMFCDLQGFVALSENIGLEDAYTVMDDVYELLIHKVHEYEGTVNEMTGDGIMALFGAPIALEDAAQRAIRSSLSIHREISKFSNGLKEKKIIQTPLKMRIGIHTGPVLVGTLGNDLRVEFKAVGDTVNVASRMENLAKPGTTYVSDATYRQTEGLFLFEALGEKDIKGKRESVKTYQVIGPSTRKTRFDVSADRGLTPFVGRDRELELLIDSFERAKTGRGQAVSIVAEAGIGKSRLLYEFRKAVSSEYAVFLEGRCLSYSRNIAFYPILDILKANFNIGESDKDSEIREKIKKGIELVRADEATTLPFLLELFSIENSGIDRLKVSLEGKKDRIIEAVKRISLKGAEIRPLIFAYEDLHWIDRSSEDTLKIILESIPTARILMIFTFRPEFVHTWGAKTYHNQLTLNRLSNRESLLMANNFLGSEKIDQKLEELILEKTEGIPFYIEEFIKSLNDLKIIKKKDNTYCLAKDIQEVSLPSTIQDVIMARIDILPDEVKELLQTGAVIEREFSYKLIKRVMDLSEEDLLSHLSALKDSELLYERGIYPDSTYIFKHALTREVAYDSILAKRKKKLHEAIGHAIEDLYKQNIEEQYGLLAKHFIESENYDLGADFSYLASKQAEKGASFKEAIEHARNSVLCLEKLPETVDIQKKIIDARTFWAGCYQWLTNNAKAKDVIAPIVDLALKINYRKRLPAIYSVLGTHSIWVKEEYSKGAQYLEKVCKIAEETGDTYALWYANHYLGLAFSFDCDFEKGHIYLNESLRISEKGNNLIGMVAAKSNIGAWNYVLNGKINNAIEINFDSLRMAEDSGDIYAMGVAYGSYGLSCYGKGQFDEARKYLQKGLAFSEKIKQNSWGSMSSWWLGHLCTDLEDYEGAQHYYEKGNSISDEYSLLPSWKSLASLALARLKVLASHRPINLGDQFEYCKNIKVKSLEGWKARIVAEILLNLNIEYISEAEDWIRKAIEADKRNGMMFHLGRDHAFYAELSTRKKDISNAKINLGKAIEIFKKCGADGWVKKYEKELSVLS